MWHSTFLVQICLINILSNTLIQSLCRQCGMVLPSYLKNFRRPSERHCACRLSLLFESFVASYLLANRILHVSSRILHLSLNSLMRSRPTNKLSLFRSKSNVCRRSEGSPISTGIMALVVCQTVRRFLSC